jgi:DNA-binding transcriptional ArsR family regulator
MSDEKFALLLQFFKVIGNESRLKIIGLLANGERNVGELAELLDLGSGERSSRR